MNELVQVLTDFGLVFLFVVLTAILINWINNKI